MRPYAAALRTPIERVLALGAPRTDFFFDESAMAAARARLLARASRPWPGGGSCSTPRPSAVAARRSVRRAGSTPPRLRAALADGPRARPQDAPEPATRRRRRRTATTSSSIRHRRCNDWLAAGRCPHHRLLVVDLRVRAPATAAHPAGPRPRGLRARPGPVPRLPHGDDRDAGDRHRRGHRRDRLRALRPAGLRRFIARHLGAPTERASASIRRAIPGGRPVPAEVIPFRRDVHHH